MRIRDKSRVEKELTAPKSPILGLLGLASSPRLARTSSENF